MTPKPDQAAAVASIAEDDGAGVIIGAEIGAGKTLIAVEGGLERFARRWLIVAPIPVMENWQEHIALQTDGLGHFRPCGNVGYAGIKPKELKANMQAFLDGEDGFFFMGREYWIGQDWQTSEKLNAKGKKQRVRKNFYRKARTDVLIFDEAHFAASKDSRGYKTFKYFPADYKMAVTGTFFGNKFENAYTLPNAIWGDRLTDTFALWRARYCKTEYAHFTFDKLKVTGEKEKGKWVSELPNYLFIEGHKGEVLYEEHFVDLTPVQRRMYAQMDKDYATKATSGRYVLADLAVEARARLRQIAIAEISSREVEKKINGAMALVENVYFPENGASAKYEELVRLLTQHDEQVIVSLDFTRAAVRIAEWLNRDGFSAELYAGGDWVTPTKRMQNKASFMAGDTRCLVAIPAAMGTGTDGLQKVCRRLYILSETQNGVEREQLIGRVNRTGQERPVYVTNIHARDTLDLGITHSLGVQAIENQMSRQLDTKAARA